MLAIFKRELAGYYNTMYGSVLGAAILFFDGLFLWLINVKGGYIELHYPLNALCVVLLLAVPVLTMRSFAEERRQKTDLLLYSLPLSSTKIVLGKFFAAMCVLYLPMLIMLLYPAVFAAFGQIGLFSYYGAMLGFALLAMSLVCVGFFVSSLTESQAISAGITAAVLLVLYFMDVLAGYVPSSAEASLAALIAASAVMGGVVYLVCGSGTFSGAVAIVLSAASIVCYAVLGSRFAGMFPRVIGQLSPFNRFAPFLDGIFDIGALVYFVSFSAVFLVLTVQSVEKRRWS